VRLTQLASPIMMKNIIIFQKGNDLPLTTSTGNACNFYWQKLFTPEVKNLEEVGAYAK
jgi:hypothetical protein